MFKNVGSQFFYFQGINVSDGLPFTGTVTTRLVSKDGGAQTTADAVVSHLADGFYRVSPSAADTNGDYLGFHFGATGMISVTANFHTEKQGASGLREMEAGAIADDAISNAAIADGAIDLNKAPTVGIASSVLGSVGSVLADVTITMGQPVPEGYSTASGTPTLNQILHEINQTLADFGIAGTTMSVRQKDGSTAMTFTLDDPTDPTSRTRTT